MSELRLGHWTMPTGDLGRPDPLPQLLSDAGVHGRQTELEEAFEDDERRYVRYGRVPGCLPYSRWCGYSRNRTPTRHRTAVLENDILRATFLLDLGGRLWSLVHKPSGRELLYVNPVLQPVNVGTVGMWFSGGVEWNCGIRGHTPLTCSPLWAAAVTGSDGRPILRLYEFERIRCLAYQVDFSLPDGSPCLFARMRIVNPHDRETPMYWWSNIAVPELEGGRIVVPAASSVRFRYNGAVSRGSVPLQNGHDVTYPTNPSAAADSFYEVTEQDRPWISSLDPEGCGLAQMSTPRLKGRKLFRWGMRPGGRNWQRFLSPGGPPYIENPGPDPAHAARRRMVLARSIHPGGSGRRGRARGRLGRGGRGRARAARRGGNRRRAGRPLRGGGRRRRSPARCRPPPRLRLGRAGAPPARGRRRATVLLRRARLRRRVDRRPRGALA
ncbi:MAG: DUF5107 domain-containing protein [Planctomycetota bacterium]